MTMQREMDSLKYKLNESERIINSQNEEIAGLSKIVEEYEKRLVNERTDKERKTRELELMSKAKDQKERHMAVLVKEKEKVLKQMDQLVNSQSIKGRP